jgi:hypothetical protein
MRFWLERLNGFSSEILLIELADGLHDWIKLAVILFYLCPGRNRNICLSSAETRSKFSSLQHHVQTGSAHQPTINQWKMETFPEDNVELII